MKTGTTKLYLLMGGIVIASLAAYTWIVYDRGYGNGRDDLLIELTVSTPREVRRETREEPQKPDTGRATVEPIPDATIQARIEKARQEAYERARKDAENEVAALWQVIYDGEKREAKLREPKLIKLETRTLGSLVLTFYPETGESDYVHVPPPKEIEIVYFEKPVLVKETFWEKLPTYALVAASSALVTLWTMKAVQ